MNEEDRTTDEQPSGPAEPNAETQEPGSGRGMLTRLRSTKMVAGVASGLGRYFDVDPVIFRIAFGVSLFFGGFGALAYVALWLFLPDESGNTLVKSTRLGLVAAIVLIGLFIIPAGIFWDGGSWGHWGALWLLIPVAIGIGAYAILRERGESVSGGRMVAAVFVAGAAVVGFITLALIAAAATAFGYGALAATLVIIAGLALVVGAFLGGLRWLIVPALALATGVGVAAAADLELQGGIGERQYTPLTTAAIPDDGYELAIGSLDVDLRALDWKPNDVVRVKAALGIGELTVAVPEDVCVEADAHATAGELRVAGERQEGADIDSRQAIGSAATPRLEVESDVQLGELRIINDDEADIGGHHGSIDEGEAAGQRAAQARACAA